MRKILFLKMFLCSEVYYSLRDYIFEYVLFTPLHFACHFTFSTAVHCLLQVILPSTGHWSNLVHFALVYTNLSAIQFYMNTSLLVASCESKVFHIWHKDMAAAEPACPVQAGIDYLILLNINLYIPLYWRELFEMHWLTFLSTLS